MSLLSCAMRDWSCVTSESVCVVLRGKDVKPIKASSEARIEASENLNRNNGLPRKLIDLEQVNSQ